MTVAQALRSATAKLRARLDKDVAPHEARLMVAHLLGTQPAGLAVRREERWSAENDDLLAQMIDRRLQGEPLQYLLGEWSFLGLSMLVRRGVLIPRADTEVVAERAISFLRERRSRRVLDLCCGAGCIGIALAVYAEAQVVAADISAACCALAGENAARNGIPLDIRRGDLFEPVQSEERFDLMVCNPPYLSAADLTSLQAEVAFEPRLALDGGVDGLDFYRRIAAGFEQHLVDDGALLVEIGSTQAPAVRELLGDGEVLRDYAGLPRGLLVRKQGNREEETPCSKN